MQPTETTKTPEAETLPEDPSSKPRTDRKKSVPEDSSPCLSDHTSDVEVSCKKNIKFEICGHKKIGKERFKFNLLNFRTMKTKWVSTETVEEIANEELQEYVKEHNLIFRKLSLQEQLRRKRERKVVATKRHRRVCNQMSKSIKKIRTEDKSDADADKDPQDEKQEKDEDSNGTSESDQLHVVQILGHKKVPKEGVKFFLKFSDGSTEWSDYDCAILDCPSLLREYMRLNQKVAPPKEDKQNSVSASVGTQKKTPNPRPEPATKPLRQSSRIRKDNTSVLI